MEVRSEQFGVGLQNYQVLSQPSMQNTRLAFTTDGVAIYKQVNDGSNSPTYQGPASVEEAPGGGGDGAIMMQGTAPLGMSSNTGEPVKRKRGRPRKYGLDGSLSLGLGSISSSPAAAAGTTGFSSPLSGTRPNSAQPASSAVTGKKRGRPLGSRTKKHLTALGTAGSGFTPHVITIQAGEDVYSKIMSFSHHGPCAVCIMSASGAISNVTLRQAAISGGTVTYEGRFEILSLSGSFLLSEIGEQRSRTGGLSVSLAGPDGRVLGGGVAGLLTAASPVQVMVGTFVANVPRESNLVDSLEPSSAPDKLASGMDTGAGASNPRVAASETSGGSGSPPNHQAFASFSNHNQGMTSIPW